MWATRSGLEQQIDSIVGGGGRSYGGVDGLADLLNFAARGRGVSRELA
jgi:hypothetical protein